jgi:hypothetical protein
LALMIFISVAWATLACFTAVPKLTKHDNAFLYLITILFLCNGSWIIIEEMQKIVLSKELADYFAYLVFRTVIIPVGIMICENLRYSGTMKHQKKLVYVFFYSVLFILEWIAVGIGVYQYKGWSSHYSILGVALLHLLIVLVWRCFRYFTRKEVYRDVF